MGREEGLDHLQNLHEGLCEFLELFYFVSATPF